MTTDALGIYVHVPFCKRKCSYCDFCSFAGEGDAVREAYLNAITAEINSYKSEKRLRCDTVFFGGGTPSLLSEKEICRIVDALHSTFDFSIDTEFTIEMNPGTVTKEKLSLYKSLGVNRLSIGLQSIHENELKILGRIHTYDDFLYTYNTARALGFSNVSVDLMYGIPDQTKESFDKTLREISNLSPEHVSAYSLIVEPGTPFYLRRDSLNLPSEDCEYSMYESAVSILDSFGYSHYEISNYARAGYESGHNLKYWRLSDYIGFGPSAYSAYNGKRFGNTADLSLYTSGKWLNPESVEILDISTIAYEYVMLGLRLSVGVSLSDYKKRFGVDFLIGREKLIEDFCRAGLMMHRADRLSLTDKGLYVSNSILTELI